MNKNISSLLAMITTAGLLSCAVSGKYEPPTSGDVSYVSVTNLALARLTGERSTTNYRLGIIEENGCVSGIATQLIDPDALDEKNRVHVPANTELALVATYFGRYGTCSIATAVTFKKNGKYTWDLEISDSACTVKVTKRIENGGYIPVSLKQMTDGLEKFGQVTANYCKVD